MMFSRTRICFLYTSYAIYFRVVVGPGSFKRWSCQADECENGRGDAVELLQNFGHANVQLPKGANASQHTTKTTTTTEPLIVCEEIREKYNIPSLLIC